MKRNFLLSLAGATLCAVTSPAQTASASVETNSVWLSVDFPTNNTAELSIHATVPGRAYELLSASDLAGPWWSQGFLAGDTNQFATNIVAASDQQFFQVRCFPRSGQLLVTMAGETSLTAYVNGELNVFAALFGSSVLLDGPIYSLDVGYDAEDDGPSGLPLLAPQDVLSISGFGPALTEFTNLCASYNPLTRLDLSDLPALQDVECYECPQLASVQITNCPSLLRACFEQCALEGILDFTGDTNLADIRAAGNLYTNVVFGGAGPNIWHLCLRDNPQLATDIAITNFPLLQELFLWNANQHGVVLPASTQLQMVQVEQNAYTCADLSNQTNLVYLLIQQNSLTNLLLSGCPSLGHVEAQQNLLPGDALDNILSNLDAAGLTNGYLDLSANAGLPSSGGLSAATNLLQKGWTVLLDW
jgi:hypothetical protein